MGACPSDLPEADFSDYTEEERRRILLTVIVFTDYSQHIENKTNALVAEERAKRGWVHFFRPKPMSDSDNGSLPVFCFLPPTDEVSIQKLLLCAAFVVCITANLALNVASFVMQVYARRFRPDSPVQFFIASIYVINALVTHIKLTMNQKNYAQIPFSLPSLVLERLVRLWMFGSVSCHLYFFAGAYARILLPWMVVVVALIGYLQLAHKRTRYVTIGCVCFFGFLFAFFVFPEVAAVNFEWIHRRVHHAKAFIMVVRSSICSTSTVPSLLYNVSLEVVLPFIALSVIGGLMLWLYFSVDDYNEHKPKYLRLVWIQLLSLCLICLCNSPHYIPLSLQQAIHVAHDTKLEYVLQLLPFIGTSLHWLPFCYMSSYYHEIKEAEIKAKESKISCTEGVNMRLLHPNHARRLV